MTDSNLEILIIPVLRDNYIFLLHDHGAGKTAVVDPAQAGPVLKMLAEKGWSLDYIFNTHHHWDHTGGNQALKDATGCFIYGPAGERQDIPGIDETLAEGDTVTFGSRTAGILEVPGHTRGHIAYWFRDDRALFCGDTLFAMGCGRLFEGTPEQMWASLRKLRDLPEDTRVYCAHEYTLDNGRFAETVDGSNAALRQRMKKEQQARAAGKPTIPTTIRAERATNPFLRADADSLQQDAGLAGETPEKVFAEIRARKDTF